MLLPAKYEPDHRGMRKDAFAGAFISRVAPQIGRYIAKSVGNVGKRYAGNAKYIAGKVTFNKDLASAGSAARKAAIESTEAAAKGVKDNFTNSSNFFARQVPKAYTTANVAAPLAFGGAMAHDNFVAPEDRWNVNGAWMLPFNPIATAAVMGGNAMYGYRLNNASGDIEAAARQGSANALQDSYEALQANPELFRKGAYGEAIQERYKAYNESLAPYDEGKRVTSYDDFYNGTKRNIAPKRETLWENIRAVADESEMKPFDMEVKDRIHNGIIDNLPRNSFDEAAYRMGKSAMHKSAMHKEAWAPLIPLIGAGARAALPWIARTALPFAGKAFGAVKKVVGPALMTGFPAWSMWRGATSDFEEEKDDARRQGEVATHASVAKRMDGMTDFERSVAEQDPTLAASRFNQATGGDFGKSYAASHGGLAPNLGGIAKFENGMASSKTHQGTYYISPSGRKIYT